MDELLDALMNPEQAQTDDGVPASDAIEFNDKEMLQALQKFIVQSVTEVESSKGEQVRRVQRYREAINMRDYSVKERLTPSALSIRTPLMQQKIREFSAAMIGGFNTTPFVYAEVPDGQDSSCAKFLEKAVSLELRDAEYVTALEMALEESGITGLGVIKITVAPDEEAAGRFNFQFGVVDVEDFWRYPWNVKKLDQCMMVGERFYLTGQQIKDFGYSGYYDPEAAKAAFGQEDPKKEGGRVDRETLGQFDTSGVSDPRGKLVECFELYIKWEIEEGQPSQWIRVVAAGERKIILRAERYDDGMPYFPVRHKRKPQTLECIPFTALAYDMNFTIDQLFSAMIEQDKMSGGLVRVAANSEMATILEERLEADGNAYIAPGEIVFAQKDEIEILQFAPANNNIDARINRALGFIESATLPSMPLNTERSATETRFAAANVSEVQRQYMRSITQDLLPQLEYIKRLYWTYFTVPDENIPDTKYIPLGMENKMVDPLVYRMISLRPRGTSTRADQVLAQQGLAALQQVKQDLLQRPIYEQAGVWPLMWNQMRYLLENSGIGDYEQYIGESPERDPNTVRIEYNQEQAMGALGAYSAVQNNRVGMQGDGARMSDGALTTPPGGQVANANGNAVM